MKNPAILAAYLHYTDLFTKADEKDRYKYLQILQLLIEIEDLEKNL